MPRKRAGRVAGRTKRHGRNMSDGMAERVRTAQRGLAWYAFLCQSVVYALSQATQPLAEILVEFL